MVRKDTTGVWLCCPWTSSGVNPESFTKPLPFSCYARTQRANNRETFHLLLKFCREMRNFEWVLFFPRTTLLCYCSLANIDFSHDGHLPWSRLPEIFLIVERLVTPRSFFTIQPITRTSMKPFACPHKFWVISWCQ